MWNLINNDFERHRSHVSLGALGKDAESGDLLISPVD
jgi:hypothetical protein